VDGAEDRSVGTGTVADGTRTDWENVAPSPAGLFQSTRQINNVAAAYRDAGMPQPMDGTSEPRRLTIARVTDDALTMVQRSRARVQWQYGLPVSQFSPAVVSPKPDLDASDGPLSSVTVAQRPFQTQP